MNAGFGWLVLSRVIGRDEVLFRRVAAFLNAPVTFLTRVSVPSFQKNAVAVSHCKVGKGIIKVNGAADDDHPSQPRESARRSRRPRSLPSSLFMNPPNHRYVAGMPIELLEPEIMRYKVFEPIYLLGRERFAKVDIRCRVSGGGHVSQIYGAPLLPKEGKANLRRVRQPPPGP